MSVNEKTASSWPEFEEILTELYAHRAQCAESGLYVSDLLFRGHGNREWRLDTTLERNFREAVRIRDYYGWLGRIRSQTESYTDRAWEFPEPDELRAWMEKHSSQAPINWPAYELMAYARHHGFPSPLLDWSRSPYVAAYFAFRHATDSSDDVAIFAFLEYAGGSKCGRVGAPQIVEQGPYVRTHPRHYAQQSHYTVCVEKNIEGEWVFANHERVIMDGDGTQDLLWKVVLPASMRVEALRVLDRYNLSAYSLFGSEESLMETLFQREVLLRLTGE